MIRYALRCECGHAFDSWFADSAAYDRQHERGLVTCPVCDSANVEKAIMAPRLAKGDRARKAGGDNRDVIDNLPTVQTSAEPAAPLMMAPHEREIVAKLRELREHVTKTAEDVGSRFPNEARKMHYGDTEHRAIYGEATKDEARELIEEGIEVLPLPVLPDDRN
ncbi:MAG: DUF1178 family protein [Bradyrhizobiaceae bacterium]|nr:MAG: DUF1178 family protein [Bradyrhizobiaceae bacterium]